MKFPGDLTEEERHEAFDQLRKIAVEHWGEKRATLIESSLVEASVAIARLNRLHFSRDDAPGFFLHETAGRDDDSDRVP